MGRLLYIYLEAKGERDGEIFTYLFRSKGGERWGDFYSNNCNSSCRPACLHGYVPEHVKLIPATFHFISFQSPFKFPQRCPPEFYSVTIHISFQEFLPVISRIQPTSQEHGKHVTHSPFSATSTSLLILLTDPHQSPHPAD